MTSEAPERPLKRPRTGRRPAAAAAGAAAGQSLEPKPDAGGNQAAAQPRNSGKTSPSPNAEPETEDDDLEFEDVDMPKPVVQTAYLSSDHEESEEDEDLQFEDIEIPAPSTSEEQADEAAGTLNLNLTAAEAALTPSKRSRKQPISKDEKELRIKVHQMHLLCLLAHVEKRNHWCNDPVVQGTLRSLLEPKTIQFLNPRSDLNQFGRTESIKNGLLSVRYTFREMFQITEIGLRRALWAEDKADLQDYQLPRNIDNCLDKAEFRKAASSLKGSRDVGAQLSCALLRSVGVDARLVCSLQPLPFLTGGPTLPKPRQTKPASSMRQSRAETIKESPHPVYWVEILDVGHQKWQPVDVLVTGTHFRPTKLEPPANDPRNTLSYVIAFEEDGTAKDVTRRYAKAYNSKTRRMRIDGPVVPSSMEGAKWWRKVMRRYRHRALTTTLDQIEDAELNAALAREPMPRNVADFKDHPIYALERHLRRHEVLVPEAQVVGTVGAGSKGPLEKIYRRKDVRVARSVDKWYRMGREINVGAEPMKVLRKRKVARNKKRAFNYDEPPESSSDEDPVLGIDPAKGTPIFTFDQTHLYVPPPVVNGRIPKNKFGNLDVYVPSMVPAGGTHIAHPRAGHAAHVLGVDYAPALMGFDWKGRKGTAIYNGVVVPQDAAEGVWATIQGFEDIEAQAEEEKRRRRALLTWKNWLRTLRIRRRLFEGDEYWGDTVLEEGFEVPEESEDDAEDEAGDGGFLLDDNDEDEGGGGGGFEPGGFELEPGGFERCGYEPGGFDPGGFDPHDAGPGGFEVDDFETGGFEPSGLISDADQGAQQRGKAKKPQLSVPHESDVGFDHVKTDPVEISESGGGFLVDADVGMVDVLPEKPINVQHIKEASEETGDCKATQQEMINVPDVSAEASGGHGATTETSALPTDDVAVGATTSAESADPLEQQTQAREEKAYEGESCETEGQHGPAEEDDEFADEPSDTTEEFYMDEDGELLD